MPLVSCSSLPIYTPTQLTHLHNLLARVCFQVTDVTRATMESCQSLLQYARILPRDDYVPEYAFQECSLCQAMELELAGPPKLVLKDRVRVLCGLASVCMIVWVLSLLRASILVKCCSLTFIWLRKDVLLLNILRSR